MARNHRGRGQVSIAYLALLALAVLVVVVLVVRQVWRASTAQVWVARDTLKAGETIDPSKLVLASVAKDSLPVGVATDPSVLLGKPLVRALEKGKPVTVSDVTPPPSYRSLAEAPPEGRVVMTITAPANLPFSQLRYGDRLDLLSTDGEGKVRVVGHNLVLLGTMMPQRRREANGVAATVSAATGHKGSAPPAVIVAVDPNDVVAITQAQTLTRLSYVVHGRQELASGRPVEIASHEASGQVELIRGAKREMIK